MSEGKELIWVPKDKAKEYQKCTDETAQAKIIDDLIDKTKRSFRGDLESLEEDELYFKGMLIKHKKAYEKALHEHYDNVEKVWMEIQGEIPDFQKEADKITRDFNKGVDSIKNILVTLREVSATIENIHTYKLQPLLDIAKSLESTSDETKDLLYKLLSLELKK